MTPTPHPLKDGRELLVREARGDDAEGLLEFIETISRESTYLSFGPGEFEMTVEEERDLLEKSRKTPTAIYLVGLIDEEIVTTLQFTTRDRLRIRHSGEFGMSVRADHWGLGIGGSILDQLIGWGRESQVVTKINLRVRSDNERAIKLYKSRGFEHEGTIRRDFLVEETYHDHHIMGLLV